MIGIAAAFVALVMAASAWGIAAGWPFVLEPGLPRGIAAWIHLGIAFGIGNIGWGLWLLGQALRRAPGFARAFSAWHLFNVAALVALAGWTAISAHFVFQPSAHAWSLARIAAGFVLMVQLSRGARPESAAGVPGGRPPALVFAINGLLAGLLGAGAGAAAGLLLGSVLAGMLEVSCFEGGCGYFAVAISLLAALAGLVAGVVIGLRLTGRAARRSSP